ncbi:MAG: class I SAM-dependent methyltransferase [Burkholderiales bacterium]|nr:class I SAM-dependent methyltransferase [Burkholderiales bacterium]
MYSRDHPSPRYSEMLEQYRILHASGEEHRHLSADETYPGVSLMPHLERIKVLIERTGARDVLDYGSGKGIAYSISPVDIRGVGRVDNVIDYWDVDTVHCYDPCHAPYAKLPTERFDGVITTDVLEHCPEQDLPWIIEEIFGYARKFVFACIASYPALTLLPNGQNAHCTLQPLGWWRAAFETAGARHPVVRWHIVVHSLIATASGQSLLEEAAAGGVGA